MKRNYWQLTQNL